MIRADVVFDPLRRCPGSGLGDGASHVREGGLVDQLPGGGLILERGRAVRRAGCGVRRGYRRARENRGLEQCECR